MRLLALLQGNNTEDQIGYHSAFELLQAEDTLSAYKPLPWRGLVAELGWEGFCDLCIREALDFAPEAIYFQFFHTQDQPPLRKLISTLRSLPSKPVIAISGGDAFGWNRWMNNRFPSGFLRVAQAADVTFLTAMGKCAAYLSRMGVRNLVLLPLGACQVRFQPKSLQLCDYGKEFDVVFLGRHNKCRDPRSFLFYYARKRRHLVNVLHKRYGNRFGLFGPGWEGHPSWQGTVSYSSQLDYCRTSQVVFGGSPGIFQDYYTSDRPFIQGVSGVPLVDWFVPKVDNLMRDKDHWYLVRDSDSMTKEIDSLLDSDPDLRLHKAAATAEYVFKNLTQLAMMRFLVATLIALRSARISGKPAPTPRIPFFLPEVDVAKESQFAIHNWIG